MDRSGCSLQSGRIGLGRESSRPGDARADRCGLQSQRHIALPLTGDWRNGDDLEEWLIAAIDAAKEEVLVAVQELSLPGVAQALIAAKHEAFTLLCCWRTATANPGANIDPAG